MQNIVVPWRQEIISKQEIVTIASLVEREAKLHRDRPLVASVILNQLQSQYALQIDAGLCKYALLTQTKRKRIGKFKIWRQMI